MVTPLRFKNGRFRIMQITDTQESAAVAGDTLKLIKEALERYRPDLVVFTGDQIKGYSPTFKTGNVKEKVENCIRTILDPLVCRGIPFVFTFGNHDRQGLSMTEQTAYYDSFDNCLNRGSATLNVPIRAEHSDKTVFNLYVIDSNGDAKGGGYEPVTQEQIAWYRETRERLCQENGAYVKSLVFQHIPVDEYYQLLTKTDRKTKGAVRAYRTHKNEYYVLNENLVHQGEINEPASVPDVNTGEFDAFCEAGDILGMYVGHDHKNSFMGTYRGIDLGFTPSAGFNTYGNGVKRGVRIFDIDEQEPENYKTFVVTFEDLFGKKVQRPVFDFILTYLPTTVDAAIPMAVKLTLILAVLGAVIAALIRLLG